MTNSKRIDTTLPRPTLAQRLASMSTVAIVQAARALAQKGDQDGLVTTLLDEVLARLGEGETFEQVVAEVYA